VSNERGKPSSTDGRLPTGAALKEAIEEVDAETGNGLVYFMINCEHPTDFDSTLSGKAPWTGRIYAIRVSSGVKVFEKHRFEIALRI